MACFTAPATAAIITTTLRKKIPAKYHIEWLNTLFWGGVVMLIVEHIAHGEVVWYPPFFTAMQSSSATAVMLKEIATTGTAMTVSIIAVWASMVMIANAFSKKKAQQKRNTSISICGSSQHS